MSYYLVPDTRGRTENLSVTVTVDILIIATPSTALSGTCHLLEVTPSETVTAPSRIEFPQSRHPSGTVFFGLSPSRTVMAPPGTHQVSPTDLYDFQVCMVGNSENGQS